MAKPRITIEPEPVDLLIDLLGLLGLAFLLGLPLIHFNSLPDEIPTHFGSGGQPDGYSGKGVIWAISFLIFAVYLLLYFFNRYPHYSNFPVKITQENAERQYRYFLRMNRLLRAAISCSFAWVIWKMIQVAKGNASGLGPWFLPVFLAGIFLPIGYYMYHSMKDK